MNGITAAEGEFPYQASLRNIRRHICGAAILSSSWILTAAHCADDNKPPALFVRVGSIDQSKGETYDIDLVMIHENFTWTETNQDSSDDLALMRTQNSIQFNDLVQPIAIEISFIRGGERAVFAGWGEGSPSNFLQVLNYTTMSNQACRRQMPEESRNNVYSRSLCGSNVAGRGVCLGDSGGPLIIDGKLVGVSTWGVKCALGYPDVFTRVFPYRKWIADITNRDFPLPANSKCVCKNTDLGECVCSKPRV